MFSFSSSRMGSALLGRSTMRQLGSSSMQGHFNGETCRWNQIKKLKWLTLTSGTNETKAYVYSRRMATPFGMVTTDENVGGHRDASSSDTRIPNVIGDWTSQALHHPSCEEGQEGLQHVAMTLWEEGCPACDTGYSQYQTSLLGWWPFLYFPVPEASWQSWRNPPRNPILCLYIRKTSVQTELPHRPAAVAQLLSVEINRKGAWSVDKDVQHCAQLVPASFWLPLLAL